MGTGKPVKEDDRFFPVSKGMIHMPTASIMGRQIVCAYRPI
jgi:hypothetical protein